MNKQAVVLFVLIMALLSCPRKGLGETFKFKGQVIDSIGTPTRPQPIEKAGVTCKYPKDITLAEIYTDDRGIFTVDLDDHVLGREVKLIIYMPGYIETTFTVTAKEEETELFFLTPAKEEFEPCNERILISGIVKDNKNSLLEGVKVKFELHDSKDKLGSTKTDNKGCFCWVADTLLLGKKISYRATKTKFQHVSDTFYLDRGHRIDLRLVPKKEKLLQSYRPYLLGAGTGSSMFLFYYNHLHPHGDAGKWILGSVCVVSLVWLGLSFL